MNTKPRQSKSGFNCPAGKGASLALAIIFLSGCAVFHGGTPVWVENPKTVYPDNEYLSAVGAGDTRRAAENAAAGNLARIFEARIESDERLLDQTRENGKQFQRTTDFTSDINILSDQTLYNIQHAEAWKDQSGRYHAVAYLNRRETARIYRDKITEQTTRVEFLKPSADHTADPLKKYATLRTANRHAAEADQLRRQLSVIHPPSASAPPYSINELQTALAAAAKQIPVHIRINGDADQRITAILEQFITGYGFIIGQPPVLSIDGNIAVNDTGERDHGLTFVRFELDLKIKDAQNNVLISITEKGREAHKTLGQARQRSYRTLENAIQANGANRLDAYFETLIEQ